MLRLSLELWDVLLGLPVDAQFRWSHDNVLRQSCCGQAVALLSFLPAEHSSASVTKCCLRNASWSGV